MIFIVVKSRPKAEYVDDFTDEVPSSPGHSQQAGRPVLRLVRGLEDPSEYVLVEGFSTVTPARSTSPASAQEVRRRRDIATGVDALDRRSRDRRHRIRRDR